MPPSKTQLTELLKVTEEKFEKLLQENQSLQEAKQTLQQVNEASQLEIQNLSQSFFDLMEAQKMEAEQMVQLSEQVWALEEALAMSREKALEQMGSMKSKFTAMNDYMKDTLEAATQNASRMELAARVYEMSQVTDLSDIDKQLADFNDQLKPGTLKSP
jgi:hypothetical protein